MLNGFDAPSSAALPVYRSDAELKSLGRFLIGDKIGQGGCGTVYHAVDTEKQREVALKLLDRSTVSHPTLVKRFQAEALAVSRLRHPNIVRVFAAGKVGQYLYIALEYVDCKSLQHVLEDEGPLSASHSLDVVTQAATALEHAWQQKIVHRDVKPSNLLIASNGMVKLSDFGLARILDETAAANLTHEGITVGSVDYMSPEQARSSKAADVRSDMYSLGATWYHMLTGKLPYPRKGMREKMEAHVSAPIPDPRDVDANIPAAIVGVMQRMMAKNPQDRYQTPAELIADLKCDTLAIPELTDDVLMGLLE